MGPIFMVMFHDVDVPGPLLESLGELRADGPARYCDVGLSFHATFRQAEHRQPWQSPLTRPGVPASASLYGAAASAAFSTHQEAFGQALPSA